MQFITAVSRVILPAITLIIIIKCILSLWLGHPKEKTYGYIIDMSSGERHALNMWETSIGRGNSCDITLSYDSVSRTHAVFTRRIDGWYIHNVNYVRSQRLADLEARIFRLPRINASTVVKVNGTKVEKKSATVSDGDIITLGTHRLRFEVADDPVQKAGRKKKKKAKASAPSKSNISSPQYDIDRFSGNGNSYTVETPQKQSSSRKSTQPRIINKDTGESFILCGNEVTIGRGRCDIRLSSREAAKKHAVLILYEDGWALSNHSDKKGTYLNGKLITSPQLLFSGDVIGIADERLFYEGGRL